MYRDVKITLQQVAYAIQDGVEIGTVTAESQVWAKHRTATRAEFYAAEKDGHKVTDAFVVFAFEFSGQQRLTCEGQTYKIVRVYRDELDTVELNCERLVKA